MSGQIRSVCYCFVFDISDCIVHPWEKRTEWLTDHRLVHLDIVVHHPDAFALVCKSQLSERAQHPIRHDASHLAWLDVEVYSAQIGADCCDRDVGVCADICCASTDRDGIFSSQTYCADLEFVCIGMLVE